jgi:MFS family permease
MFDTEYIAIKGFDKNKTIKSSTVTIMDESEYQWNIFKMMIIWTTTVFSTYLIMFQLKYLKGNIYENTNSYAISDTVSRIFGGFIYARYGMKRALIVSYTVALMGGAGLYFVQSGQ